MYIVGILHEVRGCVIEVDILSVLWMLQRQRK